MTRAGVWEPGDYGSFNFTINARARLILAGVNSCNPDGKPRLYALGHIPVDQAHVFGVEVFEIEKELPVVIDVTLRGVGFALPFRFRISRSKGGYGCEKVDLGP
jgi:hypothetical protein